MSEAAILSMKEFSLNPLLYVCLPDYSFDWWLMSSGFILGTLLDKQMLDNFVEAKRGGISGKMGDRYINNCDDNGNGSGSGNGNGNGNGNGGGNSKITDNSNKSIWYIDAKNLYGYAMMRKLPYKDCEYYSTSLDTILNTPDDRDHGYNIVCDINTTNSCKDRTEQLALMPNKRKINDNELGYREREKGKAGSEKLISDQNKKNRIFRMLKFYVKMSVKVTKIHRVIKFEQDYTCRDYIQNNTNKRATAKTKEEKDVKKLMNNPI